MNRSAGLYSQVVCLAQCQHKRIIEFTCRRSDLSAHSCAHACQKLLMCFMLQRPLGQPRSVWVHGSDQTGPLASSHTTAARESASAFMARVAKIDVMRCPCCNQGMRVVAQERNENATKIRLHQAKRRNRSLSPVKALHPLGHNLRKA